MSIDVAQFRSLVVRPTLQKMQLWSESAEVLLVGTAMAESRLIYLKQLPNGPALGVYQMEPFTYTDLRTRLMFNYSKLADRAMAVLSMDLLPSDPEYLVSNLAAATIFARMKYYFDKQPLPAANDENGMAAYYKRVYNTPMGGAEIHTVVNVFKSVIGGFTYHG